MKEINSNLKRNELHYFVSIPAYVYTRIKLGPFEKEDDIINSAVSLHKENIIDCINKVKAHINKMKWEVTKIKYSIPVHTSYISIDVSYLEPDEVYHRRINQQKRSENRVKEEKLHQSKSELECLKRLLNKHKIKTIEDVDSKLSRSRELLSEIQEG